MVPFNSTVPERQYDSPPLKWVQPGGPTRVRRVGRQRRLAVKNVMHHMIKTSHTKQLSVLPSPRCGNNKTTNDGIVHTHRLGSTNRIRRTIPTKYLDGTRSEDMSSPNSMQQFRYVDALDRGDSYVHTTEGRRGEDQYGLVAAWFVTFNFDRGLRLFQFSTVWSLTSVTGGKHVRTRLYVTMSNG
jgi:hypothetical protein